MLPDDINQVRQRCTKEYIVTLEEARGLEWDELAKREDLVTRFVLCHPGWLPEDADLHRGLGLTGFNVRTHRGRCRSDVLWGYECPLREHEIEADHLFPGALGGPAVGTNQIWLCRLHNQWKGADLLPYPWEAGEPEWVARQLENLRRLLADGARLHI